MIRDIYKEDGTVFAVCEPLTDIAMRFPYYTTHIKTGDTVERDALFESRYAFEKCLSKWNESSKQWHYTESNPNEMI